MYQEHFGLNAPPFKITPDTQLFYTGGERGLVLDALVYAVASGEGIVKVVGEVGSGKTMLCRMLAERLPETVDSIYLANPRLTPDTILQAIALEMGLPIARTPQSNHLQVMQALHEALLEKHARGRQALILVEEAQSMPLETLEEIRLLSNLETGRSKLLQIVLFGQPELDDNLAQPHIRQLKERITHHFYLTPFNRNDTGAYLDFRLRAVGYKGPPLFSRGAIRRLNRIAQGLLRRINILADKALLAAFADNRYQVSAKDVKRAQQDSGFLVYQNASQRRLGWLLALLLCLFGGLGWLYYTRHAQPITGSFSGPSAPQPSAISAPARAEAPVAPDLLNARLQASRSWLQSAEDNAYTLQLMETENSSTQALAAYLQQSVLAELRPKLYIYPIDNEQQPGWGVVYGDFAERGQAQRALRQLPAALRNNNPFIRTVASLRQRLPATGF